jgi:hypothetical protein
MIIFSVALISNITQSYHFTSSQDNIGDTYFAGEGALEKWFNTVSNEAEADLSASYTGNADMSVSSNVGDYANWVVREIKDNLQDKLELDIEGTSDKAVVEIDDVKVMGYTIDNTTNEIEITVGIQASARYSRPSSRYKAYDKKVFGQMKFRFKLPEDPTFKLLGPVYSFGDFMVNGYNKDTDEIRVAKTDIRGDVYVFGSYPDKILQPQQWYYGGIFALNQANLTIDGNAYSRSFIRTGKYLQDNDDSWIEIKKDAICQSIQLFGDGDRVLLYRNAYTFDDLEVNGEDSVIGINGSFIGLNRGTRFHDESSAIVNSAPIHNLLSDASLLSRIIINGDILNRGGTFKIDDEGGSQGKGLGQIEDASLAWDNSGGFGGNAYYKTRNYDNNDELYFLEEYHSDLRTDFNTLGNIGGFLNIFQAWNVQSNNVDSWFRDYALNARGRNDGNPRGNVLPRVLDAISGYWEYELAGNDKLYRRNRDDDETYREVAVIKNLSSNFVLDNIYDLDKKYLKYGNSTWSDMLKRVDDEGVDIGSQYDLYLSSYMHALNELIEGENEEGGLKSNLLKLTHFFAERKYPESAGKGSSWFVDSNETFKDTLDDLLTLAGVKSSDDACKEYILVVPNDPGTHDINDLYEVAFPGKSLYGQRGPTYETDTKYYLIINPNPSVNLVVKGEFNGIIFTAGKVYLRTGADIRGAIVAAGMLDPLGNPDFDAIKVTESNVAELNNGDMASIYSDGEDVKIDFYLGCEPYTDFSTGLTEHNDEVDSSDVNTDNDFVSRAARVRLLRKFYNLGIDLTDIF